ncbi:cysteine-rich CWC family protein [Ralstonia sp. 25C]|uniref:cysteine-rich CWC family protein n=1 Tax=Ralstonia sp. 25C TaxID=3447363 RepID=UPI003F750423
MSGSAPNTVCAVCGAELRCGAIGDGKQPDATCWCMEEPQLPAGALRPGQGCLCPRCLREAIAQTRATSEPD